MNNREGKTKVAKHSVYFLVFLLIFFSFSSTSVIANNNMSREEHRAKALKIFKAICNYRIKLNQKYPKIPVPRVCKNLNPEEPKPATLELTIDPISINEGENTTISWASENALSCEASGAWSGEKTLTGEETVSPSVNSTYTLTCDGALGGVEKSVSVVVVLPPPPPLDVCENLEGVQESIPDGYHQEGNNCILDEEPKPVLDHLIISEFSYRGTAALEWVEIYNNTGSDVNIDGWTISDGNSGDVIPTTNIPDKSFAIIVGLTADTSLLSLPEGTIVITLANSTIGSGLNDSSNDSVTITDNNAAVVDSVSYGSGDGLVPPVATGHSIYRTSLDVDTDASLDWADNTTPTPGTF